jgi:hypothetical protein
MKNLITLCLLLAGAFVSQAQEKNANNCQCPAPEKLDYDQVRSYSHDKLIAIEPSDFNYRFEQKILEMSCVDLKNDSKETIIQKVNCMWNKYKTYFSCDSLGFHIPNGNILKFTLNFNFADFIYYMGDNYNIDFLFIDPADGKTVLQYLDEEISDTRKNGAGRIREMKEVKAFILEKREYDSKEQMFKAVK